MHETAYTRGVMASLIAVSTLVPIGCKKQNEYQKPPPPSVIVSRPLVHSVTNYLEETGTTEAIEFVEIRARVKGFLDSIHFEAGQDVKAGDLLYVIDPLPFEAILKQMEAAQAVEEAEAINAEARFKRAETLAASRTIPQEELDERRAERDVAKASIAAAVAAVDEAKLNLSYTQVKSPIDGRVGKTEIHVGNLVGATDVTHLTTVVQYDPIYASFSISETALLRALDQSPREDAKNVEKEKVPFYLQRGIDQGFPFEGHLDFADLAVDPTTRTYMARAVFPNPEHAIIPGLFVRIRMPINVQEGALLIPERAVGTDQAGDFVLVVIDGNLVERRNIRTGMKVGEFVVAEEGLQPDDRVVTDGIQRARPGAEVTPQEKPLSADSLPSESVESESPPPVAEVPTQEVAPSSEPTP